MNEIVSITSVDSVGINKYVRFWRNCYSIWITIRLQFLIPFDRLQDHLMSSQWLRFHIKHWTNRSRIFFAVIHWAECVNWKILFLPFNIINGLLLQSNQNKHCQRLPKYSRKMFIGFDFITLSAMLWQKRKVRRDSDRRRRAKRRKTQIQYLHCKRNVNMFAFSAI